MDFRKGNERMAYRCTLGNHGNCEGCGNFVTSDQRDHIHVFRGGGHKIDIICCECWLRVAVSAAAVLSALKNAGFGTPDWQTLRQLVRNNVIIGIQAEIEWPGASRN